MKLAEALIQRADAQKRIEQIKARIVRNAKVQEGDQPAENPNALLLEIEAMAADLTQLIQRINRTNIVSTLDDGTTITDAIALRDGLKTRSAIYRDLAASATVTQDRYSKSEVKFRSTVNIGEIQRRADDLARQYRDLDARIQAANWTTDLAD